MTNVIKAVNAVAANVDAVETVEDMVLVPVREAVAVEIHTLLDNIGTSYLKVGSLLNEARADFEAQKEFLAWAESEFSIKKAQCYNLMNVARVFDGNDNFSGVAMRVMLALTPYADEADIMEQAAALALNGKLDTAAVNQLTGKPTKPAVDKATLDGIAQAQAAQAAAGSAGVDDWTAPFDETATLDSTMQSAFSRVVDARTVPDAPQDAAQGVPAVNKATPLDNAVNADSERTAALLETIKQLNATIAEMQAAANERTSEREARKSAAPMLPQFKSKCMYARLGLSAEEAEKATAVKKAKRELVKLGYGEGHAAYALIEEAVVALTK